MPNCSPKWLQQFTLPPAAKYGIPISLHPYQKYFKLLSSLGHQMYLIVVTILHFHNFWRSWNFFHIFTQPLPPRKWMYIFATFIIQHFCILFFIYRRVYVVCNKFSCQLYAFKNIFSALNLAFTFPNGIFSGKAINFNIINLSHFFYYLFSDIFKNSLYLPVMKKILFYIKILKLSYIEIFNIQDFCMCYEQNIYSLN